MNKDFARKLIEYAGDDKTTDRLFAEPIKGIFWVDWREADDDIIEMASACLPAGNDMRPEWIDDKLHIRFRDKLTLVPLAFKPGEQDVTLLTLNRALVPDFEIRMVKASDGGDTLAFILLENADWAELEAAYGSRVHDAFGRLEAGSALFAHDSTPAPAVAAPAAPTRAAEASARVTEARELASENRTNEAIAIYDDVVQRFGDENHAEYASVKFSILIALISRGAAQNDANKIQDAIASYEEADRRFGDDTNRGTRDLICTALYYRTLCLKALARHAEEVTAIEELDKRYGTESSRDISEMVTAALVNRAYTLGVLNRLAEQALAYDQFVQRFESDPSPGIVAHVALALNGSAYSRMMNAKRDWGDRATRIALLAKAVPNLRRALTTCEEKRRVMILGNLGYALFLSGDEMGSARETQECLRLGGKAALDGQRSDAAAFRVAEVDAPYEEMLMRLWGKLSRAGV